MLPSASAQSRELSSQSGVGSSVGPPEKKERHLQFALCNSQASILLMTVNAPSDRFLRASLADQGHSTLLESKWEVV